MNILVCTKLLIAHLLAQFFLTFKIVHFVNEEDHADGAEIHGGNNLGPNDEKENQKGIMIFDSDTIVDPWTVMIKSFNTLVTDGTVLAPGRANDFAIRAKISWVNVT